MNCSNCSAQITEEMKFCTKCGKPVSAPPAAQVYEPQSVPQYPPAPAPPVVRPAAQQNAPPVPAQPQYAPPPMPKPPPSPQYAPPPQPTPQPPVYAMPAPPQYQPSTPAPPPQYAPPQQQYTSPMPPSYPPPTSGKKSGGKTAIITGAIFVFLLGVTIGGHFLNLYTLPFMPQKANQGENNGENDPEKISSGDMNTPEQSPTPSATTIPDVFQDGIYVGEYDANGKRSGYGVGAYHNYRYEGYWENDMPNGEGVLKSTVGEIVDRQPDIIYAEVVTVHAYWTDGLAYGTVVLTWYMEDGQACIWYFDVDGGYPKNEESVQSTIGDATLSLTKDWLIAGVPPWADVITNPLAPPPPPYTNSFVDPAPPSTSVPYEAQYIELNMDAVQLIGQTSGYLYQENGDSRWSGMTRDGPLSQYMDFYSNSGTSAKYPFTFYMDTEKDSNQILEIANSGGPDGNWPDNLTIARIEAWDYDVWYSQSNLHLLFDANVPLTYSNMRLYFDIQREWLVEYDPDDWFWDGYDHDIWCVIFTSGQYAITGEFYEKDGDLVMFRAEISTR